MQMFTRSNGWEGYSVHPRGGTCGAKAIVEACRILSDRHNSDAIFANRTMQSEIVRGR